MSEIPSFEKWMEDGPFIPMSKDEQDHASWKCGGGPHVYDPRNPYHQQRGNTTPPEHLEALRNEVAGHGWQPHLNSALQTHQESKKTERSAPPETPKGIDIDKMHNPSMGGYRRIVDVRTDLL